MQQHSNVNQGFEPDEDDGTITETLTEKKEDEEEISNIDRERPNTETYVMYKRRWIGMFAIFVLNLSTGLVWLTFNAVSAISEEWLNTGQTQVNLTVILYFIGYIVMSSVSGFIFEKWGIKKALIIGGVINLIGTWTRYFASFIESTPESYELRLTIVLVGQFIAATGQPFFLNAPPKFAAVWFSESTRTTGTTIGSVSNPFAAAVAMVVIPELCKESDNMPFTLLIVAIVATVAVIPAVLMPSFPPTPPSGSAEMNAALEEAADEPFWVSFRKTWTNKQFWLLFVAFSVYVGFFNAFSSLINQIVKPYGYDDDDAGIFGACLIVCGIIGAGVCGVIVDKTKQHKLVLRMCTPLLGLSYVAFIFAVRKDNSVGVGAVCAAIGVFSFALLPVALELGIECTYPVPPSSSTSLLWMGGQTLAVIFLVVGDELRDDSADADPPKNMKTALIAMGALSTLTAAFSWFYNSPNYRLEAERRRREETVTAQRGNA